MNKVLAKSIQTYNQNLFKSRFEYSIVLSRMFYSYGKTLISAGMPKLLREENIKMYIMFDVFAFVDVCKSINMK